MSFLEDGGLGRRDGVVVAVSGAVGRLSDDVPTKGRAMTRAMLRDGFVEDTAGGLAEVRRVFRGRRYVFVGGDLEDGVGGGVVDGEAGLAVWFTEVGDDVGAGGVSVAEGGSQVTPVRVAISRRRSVGKQSGMSGK